MAKNSARGGTLTAQVNGPLLKSLRGTRKQTDVELANGIPGGHLTRFENSKPASFKYILKLADYYGKQAKELLSTDGLSSASELLTDLARLLGAKVDFGGNGDRSLEFFDPGFGKKADQGGALDEDRERNASSEV